MWKHLGHPTGHPSNLPTDKPTNVPSLKPTKIPTTMPTSNPTFKPTGDAYIVSSLFCWLLCVKFCEMKNNVSIKFFNGFDFPCKVYQNCAG